MTNHEPILPQPLDDLGQPIARAPGTPQDAAADASPEAPLEASPAAPPEPPAAASPPAGAPPTSAMAERMRSLVSQVSASPAIDETTSRVIGLQHAVSELATRMGKIETQLRELAAELAARSTPAQEREEITRAMHAALEQSMRAAVEQVLLMQVPKLLAVEAAKAATASEQRVTEHVDEAVLALAEALLTSRSRPAAVPAPAAGTPAGEPPEPVKAKEAKDAKEAREAREAREAKPPKPKVTRAQANGTKPPAEPQPASPPQAPATTPEAASAPPRSSIGELLEDDDYVPPVRNREPHPPAEPAQSAPQPVAREAGRRRGWWRGSE